MTNKILEYPEGTKLVILSPVVHGEKGTHKDLFDKLRKDGYNDITAFWYNINIHPRYEYEQRKEAKLVVEDNGIFIEGDESRRDIVKPLADKVVAYVQDYESYASSPEVAEYLKLKKELNGTFENLGFLKNLRLI